jgi:hypothetical protein
MILPLIISLIGLTLLAARILFAFNQKSSPRHEDPELEQAWRENNADGL